MINLPRTPEELTHWKLSGEQFDYTEHNEEEIWQWIVDYGMPLFGNYFRFRKETDMGLGGDTYVYFFDEQIILVSGHAFEESKYKFTDLASIFGDFDYDAVLI